jgi:copper homeostasis protein
MMEVEICAFSVESCVNAQAAGADRIELCASPLEGGTTPNHGLVALALKNVSIPIYVMIRPRGGDFCYDALEFEQMKLDVIAAKKLGVAGVVFGILLPNGQIDVSRTRALVELSAPLGVTFHRAFDRAVAPFEALEDIIDTGCERILTSGQKPTALEGIELLKKIVIQARNRIKIMAGSGVEEANAAALAAAGVHDLHLTAKATRMGAMYYQNADLQDDNRIIFSDVIKIADVVKHKNTP